MRWCSGAGSATIHHGDSSLRDGGREGGRCSANDSLAEETQGKPSTTRYSFPLHPPCLLTCVLLSHFSVLIMVHVNSVPLQQTSPFFVLFKVNARRDFHPTLPIHHLLIFNLILPLSPLNIPFLYFFFLFSLLFHFFSPKFIISFHDPLLLSHLHILSLATSLHLFVLNWTLPNVYSLTYYHVRFLAKGAWFSSMPQKSQFLNVSTRFLLFNCPLLPQLIFLASPYFTV